MPTQAEATEEFYRRTREEGHVAKFIAASVGRTEKSAARLDWESRRRYAQGIGMGFNEPHPDEKRQRWQLEGSPGDGPPRQLAPIEIDYLTDMEMDEPKALVGSLVREGSLGMLHAQAGAGKTFFTFGMAASLVYGQSFLGYPVAAPASALYVDGEMAAYDMRERGRLLTLPMKAGVPADQERGRLFVVTPDLHPEGIPKVDSEEGRDALMSLIGISPEIRLVVLDNLACLTRPDGDDSHGAKSFSIVQDLMLQLRSRNIACWIVHHSGKSGEQRGTSKRADVLDVVIRLTPVPSADGRTEVTVAFEKARHMKPDEKTNFMACLEPAPEGEGLVWSRSATDMPIHERVRLMLIDGVPPGDIATELKTARSFVYRIKTRLEDEGEIGSRGGQRKGRTSKALSVVPSSLPLRGGQGTSEPFEPSEHRGQNEGTSRGQRGQRRHD